MKKRKTWYNVQHGSSGEKGSGTVSFKMDEGLSDKKIMSIAGGILKKNRVKPTWTKILR